MLNLQWCRARGLFGSQSPVTTVGFELRISCIQSRYLTHQAIRHDRLDGFGVPECKRFLVQTVLWSLEFVIQIIIDHDPIAV